MAERVRERAKELNFNATSFGQAAGLKSSSAANYWNGKRPYPTESLSRIAEVLSTNVEYLVAGRRGASFAAIDVSDADWEQVPFFDLRELTDTGKGPPQSWTPFRKDWLNRTLGTSSELYLVRLLTSYKSRLGDSDLHEGDLVFVRECDPTQLMDSHVVIWRRDQSMKVARYSLRARVSGDEDVITTEEVSDDQFVPVARILGKFLQRL